MRTLLWRFLGAVWILSGSVVSAQTPAKPAPGLRVDFTVAMVDGAAPRDVMWVDAKGGEHPVVINSATRSPIYNYTGAQPMLLWTKADGVRKPLASVSLPPTEVSRLLILLMPNEDKAEGKPPYLGLAVDDSLKGGPGGSLRLLNLTGGPIAMDLNGQRSMLSPGPSQAFPVSTQPNAVVQVSLRLGASFAGDMRIIHQGRVKVATNERVTMLIVGRQGGESAPRIRILREEVQVEKPIK